MHLKSKRGDAEEAVLSGTALAGALRHRALKIGATVGDADRARTLVDSLFGPRIEGSETVPSAGRIWVDETVIDDPLELVVTRVKIDRFTGGSYPGALFDQQPLYGTPATNVKVSLQVRNPTDADMGLLLLLLKDLWTSDLPLGGEAAVGRGRLAGKRATLALKRKDPLTAVSWEIEQEASGALSVVGDPADLEQRVCAFYKEMQP